MDIYEPEHDGGLDVAKAVAELKKTGAMTDGMRRASIAEIQTAALLDIAASLRPLAAESLAAMSGLLEAFAEEEEEDGAEPRPTIVGDIVALRNDETHGVFGEIVDIGVDQDTFYAVVDTYDGGQVRVWLDELERLEGDAGTEPDPLASVILPSGEKLEPVDGEPVTLPVISEPEVVAEAVADDIDDDFEGDAHDEAAAAVERLKAAEAARKAAKKSTAKKGKKS